MMEPVKEKSVLAVEGEDEVNFFKALLKYLNIKDVAVRPVGGKDNFKYNLPALVKTSGFSDVEALAIIRDADEDADNAFLSIKNILEKLNLKPPLKRNHFSSKGKPTVGIFIMPGNSDKGMLEDLCLKTVDGKSVMKCVNTFAECVLKLNNPPQNISKTKAQAYLAAMPKIVNNVGLGAQKGYWDFDSDVLVDLKSFVIELSKRSVE